MTLEEKLHELQRELATFRQQDADNMIVRTERQAVLEKRIEALEAALRDITARVGFLEGKNSV